MWANEDDDSVECRKAGESVFAALMSHCYAGQNGPLVIELTCSVRQETARLGCPQNHLRLRHPSELRIQKTDRSNTITVTLLLLLQQTPT